MSKSSQWVVLNCRLASTLVNKASDIHGTGAFAAKNFAKGEVIAEISGDISDEPHDAYDIYLGAGRYLVSVEPHDQSYYVNHSCHPNAEAHTDGEPPKLLAIEDISIGEEVTTDYSLTMRHGTKMECACGSSKCEHTIRGTVGD